MQTWKPKLQYSESHVATMALLLSQNGLRSNLRASNFYNFPEGACPQTPTLACLWKLDIQVTPLPKILAMGLTSCVLSCSE